MEQKWKILAAEKRQRLAGAIPREWLASIPSPPLQQPDVTAFPRQCGVLSDKEEEITEVTDVDYLLRKLAQAQWSAVEVTTAFCKRAVIAHQTVSAFPSLVVTSHTRTDELPIRSFLRQSFDASRRARPISKGSWQGCRTVTRSANIPEGYVQYQGHRNH